MRMRAFDISTRIASTPAGIILALIWGMAEALFWPILPDFAVFALVPTVPSRWWRLGTAAAVGSVAGGTIGYWIASLGDPSALLAHLPLVTQGMIHQTGIWVASDGALAVLRQPLSGVPYKVFVYLSGAGKVSFPAYLWASAVARSVRLLAIAGVAAVLGRVSARLIRRWYGVALLLFTAVFAVGLARVVATFPAP